MTVKYKHYKGGEYNLLHYAEHTENGEMLVVYKDMNGLIWARPKDMFFEKVLVRDKLIERFKPLN